VLIFTLLFTSVSGERKGVIGWAVAHDDDVRGREGFEMHESVVSVTEIFQQSNVI